MIERRKQYKYVIKIPSLGDRLQSMRAIFSHLFSKLHIIMLARATPNGDLIAV